MPSRAKLAVATVLSGQQIGRVVGFSTRHKIKHFGVLFDTATWGDPTVEAQLFFNMYESAEVRFIRRHLIGVPAVVELGGGLGVTGCHVLDVMSKEGSLVSVEANPMLLPILLSTLRDHADGRRVEVIHAAVSGDQNVRFSIAESHLVSHVDEIGSSVPSVSLKSIVRNSGFTEWALVSDIEGSEASFLTDGGALEGCTRMIIELHSTEYKSRAYTIDDLIGLAHERGFYLLERYGLGGVCAFAR